MKDKDFRKKVRKVIQSNSKSEDTKYNNKPSNYTLEPESKISPEPSQDTVSMEDIMHATPKGREVVEKAIENSIEVQSKMTKKAQATSLDDIRKCFRDTYMETDGDTELFDTEETIKAISAWHKAEVAKLFEQIRSEVIKDDKDIDFPENAGNHWTYPKIRNRLRAEQLEALTRLEDNKWREFMRYKVDEETIARLAEAVEKFEDKLNSGKTDWERQERDRREIDSLISKVAENERIINAQKQWRDSLEARDLEAQGKELDAREAEITKKRKEIEDLAYNKGYVAGYVEITQKLGKAS